MTLDETCKSIREVLPRDQLSITCLSLKEKCVVSLLLGYLILFSFSSGFFLPPNSRLLRNHEYILSNFYLAV